MGIMASIRHEFGAQFEREYIHYYAGGKRFVLFDFYLPQHKIAIELDGKIHASQYSYDKARDIFFATLGIRTVRFSNKECLKTPGAVAEKVRREVDAGCNSDRNKGNEQG